MIGINKVPWSVMRSVLKEAVRCGVLFCGATVATSGCSHSDCAVPSIPIAGSLVVSLDDARQISGVDDLRSNPDGDDDQPGHLSSEPPGACRVFDPQVAFGNNWTQFRSAVYNGFADEPIAGVSEPGSKEPGITGGAASLPPKPLMIGQAVGIYPDQVAARVAFESLIPALIECSELHARYYKFAVDQPDESTVVLNYDIDSKVIYHVKNSTLINLSASGFSESGHIADAVLRNITDRIK